MTGSSRRAHDGTPLLDDTGQCRLPRLVEWIKARNPEAAARVGRRILDAAEALAAHPYLGKPGRVSGTRELVVTRFPYVIVYEVEAAGEPTVIILRVLHGAMLWPRESESD